MSEEELRLLKEKIQEHEKRITELENILKGKKKFLLLKKQQEFKSWLQNLVFQWTNLMKCLIKKKTR